MSCHGGSRQVDFKRRYIDLRGEPVSAHLIKHLGGRRDDPHAVEYGDCPIVTTVREWPATHVYSLLCV